MCGICGKLDFTGSRIEEGLIRRMTDRLAHRGPDDSGVYLSHPDSVSCGLGHRRLNIIDLSEAGRQPMTNEDGTLRMVFNGEIYNFSVLRDELERKGHRFSSRTDSEAILHLFEEEGTAGISKLIGMFAFAIWSEKTKTLFLARDPVGIKPLVYYRDGKRFLFASEIGALLADPEVQQEIDLEALDLYLSLNYIPAPYTIFKNISKLQPGHLLAVHDGALDEKVFQDIPALGGGSAAAGPGGFPEKSGQGYLHGAAAKLDFEETKRKLFRTLDDAVRSQMVADVPLGAFLSGGIDSSVIVGLMARNSNRPISTYSVGFSDMPMYDETAYAREVAVFHHTEHHEIVLESAEMIKVVPEVLAAFDEPFGDSSAVPTYIVSRETAREVKVALSGDGGDELFAGYRMYRGEEWLKRYLHLPRLLRGKIVEPLLNLLPESRDSRQGEQVRRMKKFLRGAKNTLPERFLALNELFAPDAKKMLLENDYLSANSPAFALFGAALARPQSDALNRMLCADFKVSLPGDMLWKVDKMSMAHSLEVRVPLLDQAFCEEAFRIGGDWKLRNGKGKYIFIETFKDILPRKLHNRPKWGFEMPIARWLKTDLKYLISEYLSEKKLKAQGIFAAPAVAALVQELARGREDVSWKIWNLIVFQAWHESFRK